MEIIPVVPRGYCKGVVRAINLAKKAVLDYPNQPITMLGMIVHNKHVVEACENLGISCLEQKGKTRLELLDEIDRGVVIFTAHGVSKQVIKKAIDKGLTIVDASCDDVSRTQQIVQDYLDNDFDILYVGKKNHPEAEAVIALSERVHFIETVNDIEKLGTFEQCMITNQTTMSISEIFYCLEYAKNKYPHLVVLDEICNATRIRQEAIMNLKNIDCLIVVGDPTSNNSNKLKEIALSNNIPSVYLVESANDLEKSWFKDINRVAITSGASTPTYLTNQVIQALTSFNESGELKKVSIDYNHLLD